MTYNVFSGTLNPTQSKPTISRSPVITWHTTYRQSIRGWVSSVRECHWSKEASAALHCRADKQPVLLWSVRGRHTHTHRQTYNSGCLCWESSVTRDNKWTSLTTSTRLRGRTLERQTADQALNNHTPSTLTHSLHHSLTDAQFSDQALNNHTPTTLTRSITPSLTLNSVTRHWTTTHHQHSLPPSLPHWRSIQWPGTEQPHTINTHSLHHSLTDAQFSDQALNNHTPTTVTHSITPSLTLNSVTRHWTTTHHQHSLLHHSLTDAQFSDQALNNHTPSTLTRSITPSLTLNSVTRHWTTTHHQHSLTHSITHWLTLNSVT